MRVIPSSAKALKTQSAHRVTVTGEALRTGIDIVQVSRVAESIQCFGARFLNRLFTSAEIAYAQSSAAQCNDRLAARFAAKEAALKALDLCHEAVNWRELEVCRDADGSCRLQLHGRAAALVAARGASQLSLSMSHEADYATAVVVWLRKDAGSPALPPLFAITPSPP